MKTFTNEECQVMVKAVEGLAKAVKILADHIGLNLEADTFQHYADGFRDSSNFADRTINQLKKIQKRLQEK